MTSFEPTICSIAATVDTLSHITKEVSTAICVRLRLAYPRPCYCLQSTSALRLHMSNVSPSAHANNDHNNEYSPPTSTTKSSTNEETTTSTTAQSQSNMTSSLQSVAADNGPRAREHLYESFLQSRSNEILQFLSSSQHRDQHHEGYHSSSRSSSSDHSPISPDDVRLRARSDARRPANPGGLLHERRHDADQLAK